MLPSFRLSPEEFSLPAVWTILCFVFLPFKSFLLSSLYLISTNLGKMKVFLKDISHLQKIKLMGKNENGVGFLFPCEKSFFLTFIILVHFWRCLYLSSLYRKISKYYVVYFPYQKTNISVAINCDDIRKRSQRYIYCLILFYGFE